MPDRVFREALTGGWRVTLADGRTRELISINRALDVGRAPEVVLEQEEEGLIAACVGHRTD